MFEYMAAGRGIVSADLPSIREVLNEGNAAFCEPGDVRKWKAEIEKLLADEPRRLALGAQARKDAAQLTWVKRQERVMTAIISKTYS
jgi:glycosyltransferase involved in cell wall biosynthesis